MKSFLSSPASYFRQSQNISGCRISLGLFHMQNEYLIVAFLIKLLLAVKSRFISAHWLVAEDMQSLYFWWDWNYQTTVNSFSTVVLYTLYVSCTHTHTHTRKHTKPLWKSNKIYVCWIYPSGWKFLSSAPENGLE